LFDANGRTGKDLAGIDFPPIEADVRPQVVTVTALSWNE
jgi:hypothetical protein